MPLTRAPPFPQCKDEIFGEPSRGSAPSLSALVPMILVLICTEDHLRLVWRLALGLGVVPPLSLLYLRYKLNEPEEFNRERMRKFPVWLIIK